LTYYINPPYPETKLDKTIKRINESQKFDSVFKIDFDEFFERHTRMEEMETTGLEPVTCRL
jgi:hypothetical protein